MSLRLDLLQDGRVALTFPYVGWNPPVRERRVLVSGGFLRRREAWILPRPWHHETVRWVARNGAFVLSPALTQQLTLKNLAGTAPEIDQVGIAEPVSVSPPPFALKRRLVDSRRFGDLMPFQRAGVNWLDHVGGRGWIADEMGLGKTVQALAWLDVHPELRPAVIVAPAGLKLNWSVEANAWLSKRRGNAVEILSGMRPHPLRSPITILNYDILRAWRDELKACGLMAIVFDEIHFIKHRTSLRSIAAAEVATRCPCVIGLTGTPMTNRSAELWWPMHIVAPGLLPGWSRYTARYCKAKVIHGRMDVRGSAYEAELHDRISPVMLRREKADVLTQLPAKRRTVMPLPLEPAGRREYRAAASDFITWLRGKGDAAAVSAALRAETLVRIERLKQLAAMAKLPAALEWIDDAVESGPLVVFAYHHSVLNAVEHHINERQIPMVRIDGSVPMAMRHERVKQFQDGRAKIFLGQTVAAGIGLTLTASSVVTFLELGWTPGELSQAEDRCHRIGQRDAVNVYYLVAAETIEEDLIALLDAKRKTITAVIEGRAVEDEALLGKLLQRMLPRLNTPHV